MAFSEGIKILVVEDAPGDVFLIKFYLEELDPDNYEIQSVDTLADAHYKLEREAFDVVLLDLHLPDSQGMVTLSNSISKFPDEVYIVLTGLTDEKVGLEAVKNGAQDFLVKGRIDSKTLDSSIKFSFERSKLKKAVKFFGEALKALELTFDMVVFILDRKKSTVYHSQRIATFFDEKDLSIANSSELLEFFNNNEGIKNVIENEVCAECLEFEVKKGDHTYSLKCNCPEDLKDVFILSVLKKS